MDHAINVDKDINVIGSHKSFAASKRPGTLGILTRLKHNYYIMVNRWKSNNTFKEGN
jgi:hypothetical protein